MQQLQLRKGYIRCINCAHIFDGFEAVVPAEDEPTVSSAAPLPSAASVKPEFSSSRPRKGAAEPHFVVSAPEQPVNVPIRTREANEPEAFTVRDVGHDSDVGSTHIVGDAGFSAEPEANFQTGSGLYIEPRRGRQLGAGRSYQDKRSGLSVAGVFLSLLVLLGVAAAVLQAAYIYRVQLASEMPALRPALERYCELINCTVEYPRRLAQIAVMDSSLRAVREGDNAAGTEDDVSRMVLDVVLRNNFDKPQQWPSLEIELVDVSGVVTVRRALSPADYLPELSLQRPFPATSEVRVSVPITINGARVNGYQLNTYFP